MQSNAGRPRNCSPEQIAAFLQRHCLWLLLACYALASVWPGPGRAMREWHWSLAVVPGAGATLPLLLLALMLFSAAMLTDVVQIRSVSQRPWALAAGLVAVWLAPILLVFLASWIVPRAIGAPGGWELIVGLALVASMPVANSSVGWTQVVRGNLALSLALVLVSIFLCPWITPRLLGWMRWSLSADDRSYFDALIGNFSGTFFILWVILPTAAGMLGRFLLGSRRVAAIAAPLAIASIGALLMLNYINAAPAFSKLYESSQLPALLVAAILAVAISVVGLGAGWLIARLMRLEHDSQTALMFGLSMKHTGLALLLAGAVLADQRLAILMIVLATLAQHLLAGVVQWRVTKGEGGRGRAEG